MKTKAAAKAAKQPGNNNNQNALIAAIKALASATANKSTVDIGSTKGVTIEEGQHQPTSAEAAEVQLHTILKKGKLCI